MKEATTDASGHNALSPQFSPNKANLTAPQLNEGMAFLANDLTGRPRQRGGQLDRAERQRQAG